MDAKLDVLGELFVELFVVILFFGNLSKHLQALLYKILLDHTQDFVLLEGLARDVQWQVLRVHNALHKGEPFWHEFVTIVHDKHAPNVQLDIGALLLCLEHVEWCTAWHEEQSTKLQL